MFVRFAPILQPDLWAFTSGLCIRASGYQGTTLVGPLSPMTIWAFRWVFALPGKSRQGLKPNSLSLLYGPTGSRVLIQSQTADDRFSAVPTALGSSSGFDSQPFRAGLNLVVGPPGLASMAILPCHSHSTCRRKISCSLRVGVAFTPSAREDRRPGRFGRCSAKRRCDAPQPHTRSVSPATQATRASRPPGSPHRRFEKDRLRCHDR
jgi:hypothetical protein